MAAPDARARAIATLYASAQSRLERLIRDAMERGAQGTAAFYEQQLAKVHAILASLQDEAVPLAAQLVADSYGRAAFAVTDQLQAGASISFAGVHQEAINVIAGNMAARLNQAAVTVGRRTEDAFRRVALERTAAGIATGEARAAVSAALEHQLITQGVTDALTGFVDSAGKRWGLDTYAQMVARTTTREAMSAGTAGTMRAMGSDLVEISDHGPTCDICEPYAGNTYSLDGATEGYDVLDDFPPFHPNCLHVMTPAGANLDEYEAMLLGESGG